MYEFQSEEEYKEARERLAKYEEWSKRYIQKSGWTVVPADAVPPVVVTNDDRSACEVWEWKHDPPDKYFLYVSEEKQDAHTWIGQSLGLCRFGREWRDNFGGTRRSVTVYGNNGVKYFGIYFKSSGDYAVIRKAKRQGAQSYNL
ncbi:MAG: hypothetical protein WC329_08235 [Candidatus Omnitrophota bacterium]|jgi:hypothetical protein